MKIQSVPSIGVLQTAQTGQQASKDGGNGFGALLSNALESLQRLETGANDAAIGLATGEPLEIHEVMLAMEQANLGFQLALQVRNKLVEAYQEIMRIPV